MRESETASRPAKSREQSRSCHASVLHRTCSNLCHWSFEDYKRKAFLERVEIDDASVNSFGYETKG